MNWSWRLFRVAGIDVRVHWSFALILVFYALQGNSLAGAVSAVVLCLLLFLCVLLHEFGHALTARAFGIQTPDITLLPIGGVARLAKMPDKPIQEFLITIAGPMVNVVIALVLWLVLGRPPLFTTSLFPDDQEPTLVSYLFWMNKMLVVFNLIPAFPMDGGRILRSMIAMGTDYARATAIAARIGQGIAILFMIVGAFGVPQPLLERFPILASFSHDPFLVIIAMFIFMGAKREADFAKVRTVIGGMRVSDAMVTRFDSLFGDMSIEEAISQASALTQPIFPVTDAHLRLTGMIQRNELLAHDAVNPQAPVSTIAANVPSVERDAPFELAFQAIQESGSPILPVVNADRQVIGLISLNLMTERLRAARPA